MGKCIPTLGLARGLCLGELAALLLLCGRALLLLTCSTFLRLTLRTLALLCLALLARAPLAVFLDACLLLLLQLLGGLLTSLLVLCVALGAHPVAELLVRAYKTRETAL